MRVLSAILVLLLSVACGYDHQRELERQIRELSEHTSPFQQGILEDGVLTREEYRSAYEALRQCLRDAGYEPSEIFEVDSWGSLSLVFRGGSELSDLADADECDHRYTEMVAAAWALQNAPSQSEAAVRIAEFGRCLEARGISTGAEPMNLERALQLTEPVGSAGYECGVRTGLVAVVLIPEPFFPPAEDD